MFTYNFKRTQGISNGGRQGQLVLVGVIYKGTLRKEAANRF